jgi:hypothetical protein
MGALVQTELACLSESHFTALELAGERLCTCMDVHVLFQVLLESKLASTNPTFELKRFVVRRQMSAQGELSCVCLWAARLIALIVARVSELCH